MIMGAKTHVIDDMEWGSWLLYQKMKQELARTDKFSCILYDTSIYFSDGFEQTPEALRQYRLPGTG